MKTTISLISHPSKVMLKVILNRLKPQAEKIIAEGHNHKEKRFVYYLVPWREDTIVRRKGSFITSFLDERTQS